MLSVPTPDLNAFITAMRLAGFQDEYMLLLLPRALILSPGLGCTALLQWSVTYIENNDTGTKGYLKEHRSLICTHAVRPAQETITHCCLLIWCSTLTWLHCHWINLSISIRRYMPFKFLSGPALVPMLQVFSVGVCLALV